MDITSAVQEFSKLSFQQQKEKLIAMIAELKNPNQTFLDLHEMIKTWENIDSAFLITIYQDILELWEAIAQYSEGNQAKILSSLQDKLKEMHEREAQERVVEQQEVDELIKNI